MYNTQSGHVKMHENGTTTEHKTHVWSTESDSYYIESDDKYIYVNRDSGTVKFPFDREIEAIIPIYDEFVIWRNAGVYLSGECIFSSRTISNVYVDANFVRIVCSMNATQYNIFTKTLTTYRHVDHDISGSRDAGYVNINGWPVIPNYNVNMTRIQPDDTLLKRIRSILDMNLGTYLNRNVISIVDSYI